MAELQRAYHAEQETKLLTDGYQRGPGGWYPRRTAQPRRWPWRRRRPAPPIDIEELVARLPEQQR